MKNQKISLLMIIFIFFTLSLTSACSLFPKEEPDPSMAGVWYDFSSGYSFKIWWDKNEYKVSATWNGNGYGTYPQESSNDTLSWFYYDQTLTGNNTVTFKISAFTEEFLIATKTYHNREYTVQLFNIDVIDFNDE